MRPLIFIASLTLLACRAREEEPTPESVDPARAETPPVDSRLPGPARAAAAAVNVAPRLEPALAEKGLRPGDPVFIRAFKDERLLELWMRPRDSEKYVLFRSYPVAAASGAPGPKLKEGDHQVPEGFYFVGPDAMKPDSDLHLAFNIGYPNEYDRHHGRTGTFIMIHGRCVSVGCLAMTDPGIEEIYTLCDAALKHGQPFFRVHLFPFRLSDENLARAAGSPWFEFWNNLKQGHDHFETHRVPPVVTIRDGRYRFN